MKIWKDTTKEIQSINKTNLKILVQTISKNITNYINDLFREESDDPLFEYYMVENPYNEEQLRRALAELLDFYYRKDLITTYNIHKIVSEPRHVYIELHLFIMGKTVELTLKENFKEAK